MKWDEELLGENRESYDKIVCEMLKLENIELPRYLFQRGKEMLKIQIHAFSDKSEKSNATAVYMSTEYKSGEIEIKLISSKANVPPIKRQTIPKG